MTDAEGKKAVANLVRNWKAGSKSVIFCGDHSNDCGWGNLLAHGPQAGHVNAIPPISSPVRKTRLFVRFYINIIVLPRQARDKHRKIPFIDM